MVVKVLDTTFLIDLLRGREETKIVLSSKDDFVTTQINMYEVLSGIFFKGGAFKLLKARELFENIRVLPFDDSSVLKSAEISAALMKKGAMIDDCDCLIAGMALSKGITVIVTRSLSHFQRVVGLKVESY